MFVLALSLYNTWNRGVFLLCKITNLLIYSYQYTKPVIPPKLLNNKVIPQWEIDEVVCKWLYKLLDSEIEVRETISETQKALQILAKQYQ